MRNAKGTVRLDIRDFVSSLERAVNKLGMTKKRKTRSILGAVGGREFWGNRVQRG